MKKENDIITILYKYLHRNKEGKTNKQIETIV